MKQPSYNSLKLLETPWNWYSNYTSTLINIFLYKGYKWSNKDPSNDQIKAAINNNKSCGVRMESLNLKQTVRKG